MFSELSCICEEPVSIQVQVIRSDNGTEYVNSTFGSFLSDQGIHHQTSCLDTPPQNGVAERRIVMFWKLLAR